MDRSYRHAPKTVKAVSDTEVGHARPAVTRPTPQRRLRARRGDAVVTSAGSDEDVPLAVPPPPSDGKGGRVPRSLAPTAGRDPNNSLQFGDSQRGASSTRNSLQNPYGTGERVTSSHDNFDLSRRLHGTYS